jgi:hypothetical protein
MIGFRFIDKYTSLNSFVVVDEKAFTPDQDTEIFFQLWTNTELRYLPVVGALVEVTFENIDSTKVITRPATQVIPNDDRSVWKVSILPGETISAGSMTVKLTEGSTVKNLPALSQLVVTPTGGGRFFC